jgi:hypothetical protein
MTRDTQEFEGPLQRKSETRHGTTGIAILLLAGFVVTLSGAIGEVGPLASLRPIHLAVLLLFVTCFSVWSTYRSRRSVPSILLNLGLLGICLAFVALFVFLAVSPPVISPD